MSQRRALGSSTFIYNGNSYVLRPTRCTFEVGGTKRTVDLDWRPTNFEQMLQKGAFGPARRSATIGLRALPDGTRWLSLPSFDGDPGSEAGNALTAVLQTLAADGPAIRSAPAIVLDLRGNGGGSNSRSPASRARCVQANRCGRILPTRMCRGSQRVCPSTGWRGRFIW